MDLRKLALTASVLLGTFVIACTLGAFLWCVGNAFWPVFVTLGICALVASWILGSS